MRHYVSYDKNLTLQKCQCITDTLDTFPGDNCIETKVLGLLNNIAEVAHLRPHLMVDRFLANLRYTHIYF